MKKVALLLVIGLFLALGAAATTQQETGTMTGGMMDMAMMTGGDVIAAVEAGTMTGGDVQQAIAMGIMTGGDVQVLLDRGLMTGGDLGMDMMDMEEGNDGN
ncbi:hypothetical protein [Truepera radiovictrix]|uniref:Uncharacterized protein n=1 Tax=Truepera radiovictrix (strain DSM 17093 / CIP 108686 / LMG 22925 / RQ-24) TaxID=649638 RepID=D7CV14_TRURR|nr:hypothetical protein [Truepera radiovictrix]ADI15841.1 hypothetical protein Trad_2738 [Truepera radiovictrix DSM 17093]WMT58534.1 hypothetical protein RCV51_06205 [Truepera radiovictrix]